jgi:hypothetical protein
LGWEVISKIDAPLWLRLDYGVWSVNLEKAAPGLRKRIQSRWENIGHFYTWSNLITEPIEIRLAEVKRT